MYNFAPSTEAVDSRSLVMSTTRNGILKIEMRGMVGAPGQIRAEAVRRQLSENSFRHVHLVIGSVGGAADEAEQIYAALRDQPAPVSAEALGCCLSAALSIFLAASLRVAGPEVKFLIHQCNQSRETLPGRVNATDLQVVANSLRSIDLKNAERFTYRTGSSIELFLTEMANEETMEAAQALELGLIHAFHADTIDPEWPTLAAKRSADVYVPQRLLTQNYFDACRCAASLYAGGDR